MLLHELCEETRNEIIDECINSQTYLETSISNDYINSLYEMDDPTLILEYFKRFLDQSINLEDNS